MPKVTSPEELDHLVALIEAHPGGIASEALLLALQGRLQLRALQRRLSLLTAQGRIQKVGEARALRYTGIARTTDTPVHNQGPGNTLHATAEVYVPLSPEGQEIKTYVRQDRQLRAPVGYKLQFLEQYHPNHTAYLPTELRAQLHALGRSPAEQTPAGTFARDILNRLLIDLSWASSQLEGNTYSRLDTERLIAFGQAAEGKDALETQMILNHKEAIEYLVRDPDHASLTPDTIISLHAFLSDGLMADPAAVGRIRRRAVEIGGSVYMPIALPQRLEELFGIVLQIAAEIQDPFELLRDVFVWAYERSCQQYVAVKQTLVPPDIFRLSYRQALSETVASMVRACEPATDAAIRARIPASVAAIDSDHFVALVRSEFNTLHAGNAVRFGLRPLELKAWQEQPPH